MRRGLSPQAAVDDAVRRIIGKYPAYVGAVVAVDRIGRHGGACHGWNFNYAVRDGSSPGVQLFEVLPLQAQQPRTPVRHADQILKSTVNIE